MAASCDDERVAADCCSVVAPLESFVASVEKKNPHADADTDTDRCAWRGRGERPVLRVPDGRCVLFVLAGVYSHVTLRY